MVSASEDCSGTVGLGITRRNSLSTDSGGEIWVVKKIMEGCEAKGVGGFMERAMGIEPTSEAWEASILPLYDARSVRCCNGLYTIKIGFEKSRGDAAKQRLFVRLRKYPLKNSCWCADDSNRGRARSQSCARRAMERGKC